MPSSQLPLADPKDLLPIASAEDLAPVKSVRERAKENRNPQGPKAVANEQKIQAVGQMQREDIAKGVAPLIAAAPFLAIPAGLTGLAAIAATAGAAATGSLASNEFKRAIGSKQTLHGAALLNSLGVDTAVGVLSAGVGNAINSTTTGLLPRVVESSANKAAQGEKLLDDLWFNTRAKLFQLINESGARMSPPIVTRPGTALVKSTRRTLASALLNGEVDDVAARQAAEVGGGVFVPVGRELEKAFQAIKSLPKGADALGEGLGGGTARGKEILKLIEDTLVVNKGSIAMQPLAGLVRVRSTLNTAVRNANLSGEEVKVFRDLSDDLLKIINRELVDIGPEAVSLYKRANELGALKDERIAAVNVANRTIAKMFSAHKIATGVGAALGFKAGGPVGAAFGAYGAAVGSEYIPQASAWALKTALEHPQAAQSVKAAIQFATAGKTKAAEMAMARAFGVAGIRKALTDYLSASPQPGPISQAIPQQPQQ